MDEAAEPTPEEPLHLRDNEKRDKDRSDQHTNRGGNEPITGRQLARNTAINLAGFVLVGLVSIAAIPITIRRLGGDAFGILSLALVVLGYFSIFDLGLGRATIKFAAEYLAHNSVERLPRLVWISVGLQLSIGVFGGAVLAAGSPFLVRSVFRIPAALTQEAKLTLLILAAALPVVLATSALRGTLEAAQRFDLVNLVKIPANAANFLIPAAAVLLGTRLPLIVLFLCLARVAAGLTYLYLSCRLFPSLRQRTAFDFRTLRSLLVYGSWVTVSNVISPILAYFDRFVIGSLLSMTAVAYYAVPYDLANNFLILPTALVSTLFPAFSTLGASGDRRQIQQLYTRSLKFLLLTLVPSMLVLGFFASDILHLWLGAAFAERGTRVLQIFAFGVVLNSLAWIPFSLLQGSGRPDVTGKLHLAELPMYAGVAWVFVHRYGIAGGALAWSLRVGIDALLLFALCARFRFVSLRELGKNGLPRAITAIFALAGALAIPLLAGTRLLAQIATAALALAIFFVGAWFLVLDASERNLLSSAFVKSIQRSKSDGSGILRLVPKPHNESDSVREWRLD